MGSFYFKAIASDGKLRTGTLTAATEKSVAQELRKQGLTPVYVGEKPAGGLSFKLPSFGGERLNVECTRVAGVKKYYNLY